MHYLKKNSRGSMPPNPPRKAYGKFSNLGKNSWPPCQILGTSLTKELGIQKNRHSHLGHR